MKSILSTLALMFAIPSAIAGCFAESASVSQFPTKPQSSGQIAIDGSSTVAPITKLVVDEFKVNHPNQATLKLNTSGTGGGFKKFCAGETDINDASRPISLKEIDACKQAKVAYLELPVAFDAITVAVNPQNTWAKDITMTELKKLWQPIAEGKITNWRQIRSSYPDRPITLYAPDSDSGTFDYFTQMVNGTV